MPRTLRPLASVSENSHAEENPAEMLGDLFVLDGPSTRAPDMHVVVRIVGGKKTYVCGGGGSGGRIPPGTAYTFLIPVKWDGKTWVHTGNRERELMHSKNDPTTLEVVAVPHVGWKNSSKLI